MDNTGSVSERSLVATELGKSEKGMGMIWYEIL